jgi:thiamine biosynthesis protein ThiI
VAVKEAKKVLSPGSDFAVLTRRVGEHPFSSRDINREVGAAILEAVPRARVNLSTPDHKIFVEVRGNDSYIFFEIVGGIGGLPVGSQGKVVALFSGGVNSFLAACLVLKRGCLVFPIFFDESSKTNDRSRELAIDAARKFLAFHPKVELRIFPFIEVRDVFRGGVPQDLVHVLCMRARLRAAQVTGEEMEVDAIVTGETTGRTGRNLRGFRAIEGVCGLPVLRPLAGLDRRRTGQIARRMENLGVPLPLKPLSEKMRRPKADVNLRKIQELERELEMDALVRSLSKKVEVIELR